MSLHPIPLPVTSLPSFTNGAARVCASAKRSSITMLLSTLAITLAACGKGETPPPAGMSAMAVPVHTQVVQLVTAPVVVTAVGQTQGAREVEVRARVGGILLKRLYNEGDTVKAGAPLFQLDPAPYDSALSQANAEVAQQKARAEQARREESRLKPLALERAISQKEYDDALSAAQSNDALLQAAQAKLNDAQRNRSYTYVTAPVAGVTGQAARSEGSLITPSDSLLTTIKQVNPIWVNFSLAASDLDSLPGGKLNLAQVAVKLVLRDGSVYPQTGKLNFQAGNIDPRLGTQLLRAEFDNPNQTLLPGQFVKVQMQMGQREGVFRVPQSAVFQTEQGFFVFVLGADNKAEIRPVKTGNWDGQDWIILGGLKAGDQVVLDNLIKVRPGAPLQALPPAPSNAGQPQGQQPATPAKPS